MSREDQLFWLADNDPGKIEQFRRMPLVEYWSILNTRMELLKKRKNGGANNR